MRQSAKYLLALLMPVLVIISCKKTEVTPPEEFKINYISDELKAWGLFKPGSTVSGNAFTNVRHTLYSVWETVHSGGFSVWEENYWKRNVGIIKRKAILQAWLMEDMTSIWSL